jgi:hypothetical protein
MKKLLSFCFAVSLLTSYSAFSAEEFGHHNPGHGGGHHHHNPGWNYPSPGWSWGTPTYSPYTLITCYAQDSKEQWYGATGMLWQMAQVQEAANQLCDQSKLECSHDLGCTLASGTEEDSSQE